MCSAEALTIDMGESEPKKDQAILLFDGVCNTCNAVVSYLLEHDKKKQIQFASLQSEGGKKIALANGVNPELLETVVLVYQGRTYLRSEAVIQVLKLLGGAYQLLTILKAVPLPLRDAGYKAFANNRYRLFGKKDTCRIPTAEEKNRFLD